MIAPNILLGAYSMGYFPMADDNNTISWYSPDPRAIIPLDNYNIPRSTKHLIDKSIFEIEIDNNFETVIRGCADRKETWISEEIIESYIELHRLGYGHSVESIDQDGLAGGLYGVSLGTAFFRRIHVQSQKRRIKDCAGLSGETPFGKWLHTSRHSVYDSAPANIRCN